MNERSAGICGAQMPGTPGRNLICDLPAGHKGWHSAPDHTALSAGVLANVPRVDWSGETAEAKLARIEALVAQTPDWEDVNLVDLRAILTGGDV